MPDRHQDTAGRLSGVRHALRAAGDTVALDVSFLALGLGFFFIMFGPADVSNTLVIIGLFLLGFLALGLVMAALAGAEVIAEMAPWAFARWAARPFLGLVTIAGLAYGTWHDRINPFGSSYCGMPGCMGD